MSDDKHAQTAVEGTPSPLKPSFTLLAKLSAVVVHVKESQAPAADSVDLVTLATVLDDPEVVQWAKDMVGLALAPLPRHPLW